MNWSLCKNFWIITRGGGSCFFGLLKVVTLLLHGGTARPQAKCATVGWHSCLIPHNPEKMHFEKWHAIMSRGTRGFYCVNHLGATVGCLPLKVSGFARTYSPRSSTVSRPRLTPALTFRWITSWLGKRGFPAFRTVKLGVSALYFFHKWTLSQLAMFTCVCPDDVQWYMFRINCRCLVW